MLNSNGTINIQLRRTLGAGSVGTQEGVYQPFCEVGWYIKLYTCCCCCYSKDVIEWDRISPEAGVFLGSILLPCLLLRSWSILLSGRLTRYRESAQSIIRRERQKIRKAKADIFCYKRFMEDDRLQEFRPYFKRKWAHENTTMGIDLLRAEQVTSTSLSCFNKNLIYEL